MLDALRNPNTLIGVAALLATLAVPFLYRHRRSMTYRIWCNRPLLDAMEKDEGATAVVGGKKRKARDLWVYVIEVHNFDGGLLGGWGGTDIVPDRFYRPLSFVYGDGSRVLDQRVIDEDPEALQASLRAETGSETVVEPLLLNQGDSFTIRSLVARPTKERRWWGEEGKVRADVRIEGIRRIKRSPGAPDFLRRGSISTLSGMVILAGMDFVLSPILGYGILPNYAETPYRTPFSIAFGFSGALAASGLVSMASALWLQKLDENFRKEARAEYRVSGGGASKRRR